MVYRLSLVFYVFLVSFVILALSYVIYGFVRVGIVKFIFSFGYWADEKIRRYGVERVLWCEGVRVSGL